MVGHWKDLKTKEFYRHSPSKLVLEGGWWLYDFEAYCLYNNIEQNIINWANRGYKAGLELTQEKPSKYYIKYSAKEKERLFYD